MVYRAIGLMSGSSLDGLDIAYVHLQEIAGKWSYELINAECYPYSSEWKNRLKNATGLSAYEFQLLHAEYGHYLGQQVNRFIEGYNLHHQVAVVSSHGHTTFHFPERQLTSQLGDGAAIAAETGLAVISDLRALDVALGGQGAPIVPMGEKLLFSNYDLLLNLGGIANISCRYNDNYFAFDICSANAILNRLAGENGLDYDEDGKLASQGEINMELLNELNDLGFYSKGFPKSLANSFALIEVLPLVEKYRLSVSDALRTYVEHIVIQVRQSVKSLRDANQLTLLYLKMLVTGGGAFNNFLAKRMQEILVEENIIIEIPDANVVKFKEALIMALLGVLRWREEYTVLSSVTGAKKNSIGGALWLGTDA